MIKATVEKSRITIAKICWKIILWTSAKIQTESSSLPDLCATDEAEYADQYIDRLNELLVNRSKTVREIAITAPYAGGKSSIIKTYMRRFSMHKYTCITLSDYNNKIETDDNKNVEVDVNKIEKSIVQQILYRTSSDSTPNSRFRRIFPTPINYFEAIFLSSSILIWIIALILASKHQYFLLNEAQNSIYKPIFLNPYNWIISYLITIPLLIFKDFLKTIGSLNITKINIFQTELAFDPKKKDSVFNMYLEEIIYYFSTTQSDVVIFEDLDRLKSTDIFVKLKELNKLINDSNDVKQDVRFIYAIKDELFTGKTRTKFFDSIIPIIPISHKSNSYPQLKAILESTKLAENLNNEFLRDISVYIDDMRMLKNIVTEYGIYKAALSKSVKMLEWTKLFAFIVYKNLYCDDFAELNNHEGLLAELIDKVRTTRKLYSEEVTDKIRVLKDQLIKADQEIISSVEELNSLYIYRFLREVNYPAQYAFPHIDGVPFTALSKSESFDTLYSSNSTVQLTNPYSGQVFNTGKSFNFCSSEISPSFEKRKEIILNKNEANRIKRNEEIRFLEDQLLSIRNMSIKETISNFGKEKFFEDTTEKAFVHLIEKGYLDEHYHLYIAHFHEGQISKSDMDFVMSVKNGVLEKNQQTLSNCEEILKYLSHEDFHSVAAINFDLINYMIDKGLNTSLSQIIRKVIYGPDGRFEYLQEFLKNVNNLKYFFELLNREWPDVWKDIINADIITNEQKSETLVKLIMLNETGYPKEVAEFISSQNNISLLIPKDEQKARILFYKFKSMGVKFYSVSQPGADISFMENVLINEIFLESFENIANILGKLLGRSFETFINVSEVFECELTLVRDYAHSNIATFAKFVSELRARIDNERDYLRLLNSESIDRHTKLKIIEKCKFQISDINEVNSENEIWMTLFIYQQITPTWQNIAALLNINEHELALFHYLNATRTYEELSKQSILGMSEEIAYKLSEILLMDNTDIHAFHALLPLFKDEYDSSRFEEFSAEKLKIYLRHVNIKATVENYTAIRKSDAILARQFLKQKFHEYQEKNSLYELELDKNDFIGLLNSSALSIQQKQYLVYAKEDLINVDASELITNISPLLIDIESTTTPQLSEKTLTQLLPLIKKDKDKVVCLINQMKHLENASILTLAKLLGAEYEKVVTSKGASYLAKTDYNELFISELINNQLLSSYTSVEKDGTKILKINSKRI